LRASNGAGRAEAGDAAVPAGRGGGKNVWVVFGRCAGSCLGAFTALLLVSIGTHGIKQKGHHLLRWWPFVEVEFGRLWLHHPAIVGRLMPTPIRARDVRARNMSGVNYRQERAGLSTPDLVFLRRIS